MSPAFSSFIFLLCPGIACAVGTWFMTFRLSPEAKRPRLRRWLITWSLKGMLLPLTLWALINIGLAWNLPPFMPEIQAAQNGGTGWGEEFFHVAAVGTFIVTSYWAVITLGWVLASSLSILDAERHRNLKTLCRTCSVAFGIPALCIVLLGGWPLLGLAALLILAPMAGYAPNIVYPKTLPPMYARAIARMKFGKYNEAEMEIIRELEKSEDDFDGWMMLADLYANHFHDLAEAERSVLEICDQPQVTPPQLSVALHRLADWQLKLGGDPMAARRALQLVCERLRGTHLARMAQLRINQLPKTAEDLREQQTAGTIHLPALSDSMDKESLEPVQIDRAAAAKAANACVEKLKGDPDDVAAREKLARILTEQLQKPDLGIEQISLLLTLPEPPEGKRPEWLGLIGAWHLKYRQDVERGREALQQLLREYPTSVQAFAARRRLELLDTERQQQAVRQAKAPTLRIDPSST
jgi:hypothetical protein